MDCPFKGKLAREYGEQLTVNSFSGGSMQTI
jgi:hypothetical protein